MAGIDGVVEALRKELQHIDSALSVLEGGSRRLTNGRRSEIRKVRTAGGNEEFGDYYPQPREEISLAAKARWAATKLSLMARTQRITVINVAPSAIEQKIQGGSNHL